MVADIAGEPTGNNETGSKEGGYRAKRGFHQEIIALGPVFTVLFYLLAAWFLISAGPSLLASLINLNVISGGLTLVFIAVLAKYIWQGNLHGVTLTLLLVSAIGPFSFLAYPLIDSILSMPALLLYTVISLHALLFGLLSVFMMHKTTQRTSALIKSSVSLSSLLAAILSLNVLVLSFLRVLGDFINWLAELFTRDAANLTLFQEHAYNPAIAFIHAFTAFMLPFLIITLRRGDAPKKQFIWLLLPILLYASLSFLFTLFSGYIEG